MEAPTVGGRVATLAHYASPATFDGTVNGLSPGLVASDGGELVAGSRRHTHVVSIPSGPDSEIVGGADGFNISYGSIAPPPPAS